MERILNIKHEQGIGVVTDEMTVPKRIDDLDRQIESVRIEDRAARRGPPRSVLLDVMGFGREERIVDARPIDLRNQPRREDLSICLVGEGMLRDLPKRQGTAQVVAVIGSAIALDNPALRGAGEVGLRLIWNLRRRRGGCLDLLD